MDWLTQALDPAHISALFAQFQEEMRSPTFWVAVTKIIWINVLLSGDNALVIAMACRNLEPKQRLWGMILGAGVAVLLRIVFTGIVATLMVLPWLKLIGGLALIYIAIKLVVPEEENGDDVHGASSLWSAVQIVAIADIVMSLDNVIAVAAAANGSVVLMIIGLAVSVPMIVAGAAIIMAVLDRFPLLIWAGAALLGWIAGEVIATDHGLEPILHSLVPVPNALDDLLAKIGIHGSSIEIGMAAIDAAIVLAIGWAWRRKRQRAAELAEAQHAKA